MVINSPLAPTGPSRRRSLTDNTESIKNRSSIGYARSSSRCLASDGFTNSGDSSRSNKSIHNVNLHHLHPEHTQEHSDIHAEDLDQTLSSIGPAFSLLSSPVERPSSGQSTISEISNGIAARGDSPLGAVVSPILPSPQSPQQPTFNNPVPRTTSCFVVTHAEASALETTQASEHIQSAYLEAYTQAQQEQSEEPQPHNQLFSEIEELHRHPYRSLLEPRAQYFRVYNKGLKSLATQTLASKSVLLLISQGKKLLFLVSFSRHGM